MRNYEIKTLNSNDTYSEETLSVLFGIMGVCNDNRQDKLGIHPGDDLYASGETVDWGWFIDSDAYELIVALDKDKPIGFSLLVSDTDILEFKRYDIVELWVEPEYRNNSVGSLLLKHIEEMYPDDSTIKSINCYDKETKPFFIKNGYCGSGDILILDKNTITNYELDSSHRFKVILTKFNKLNKKEVNEVLSLMDDLRSYEFRFYPDYLKDFIVKSGYPKTNIEDCDSSEFDYVVVKNNLDEVIGIVKVNPDYDVNTKCLLSISCFFVREDYRNNKVGELILKTLFNTYPVKITKNNPLTFIYNLHVAEGNNRAINFYEKYGFVNTYPQLYKGGSKYVKKG